MSQSSNSSKEKTDENENQRIYAALAFAFILVVIGLPLWWKTTEVYRVPLPYSRINALDNSKIKIFMNISISALNTARGEKLAQEIEQLYQVSSLFQVKCNLVDINKKIIADAHSIGNLEVAPFNKRKPGQLLLLEVPGLARFTPGHVLAGRKRTIYFSTSATAIKLAELLQQWLLMDDMLIRTIDSMKEPTKFSKDNMGRRRMPVAAAYDILLTVVNPEPEKLFINWNLPKAIEEFVEPFVDQLSPVAKFTLKSQWLYFVTLNVQPKLIEASPQASKHFALSEEVLPHIITTLEKKLASHVSQNPCLNFVVYVPTCDASPLHLYGKRGTHVKGSVDAFLSPRWGGIIIHNPDTSVCNNNSFKEPKIVEADWSRTMGILFAQLRLLMGIPEMINIPNANIIQLPNTGLRQWELDILYRIKTLEQITSAKLTLQSLAQLLGEISNIVINDAVGESIYKAVDAVEQSMKYLQSGNLTLAFSNSKKAFLSAEAAFTDPSLLALLYFPDDQKYAVYIPLFLPVMIPVIMSVKNIRAWLLKKRAEKQKLKEE